MSSANAFKLDWPPILPFGTDLNTPLKSTFNPLPHVPILGSVPIQQQKKIRCQKYGHMGIQLSDIVENIVGEEEIARYEQFLLFPQCFQKLSVVDASK